MHTSCRNLIFRTIQWLFTVQVFTETVAYMIIIRQKELPFFTIDQFSENIYYGSNIHILTTQCAFLIIDWSRKPYFSLTLLIFINYLSIVKLSIKKPILYVSSCYWLIDNQMNIFNHLLIKENKPLNIPTPYFNIFNFKY